MTSKERVLECLKHRETDRVPFSLGFGVNPPAKEGLKNYLGLKSIAEVDKYLHSFDDIRGVGPDYKGPSYRNTTTEDGTSIDIWGVGRKQVSYGSGFYDEICYYPLGNVKDIAELDKYEWPSPDWWNVDNLKEKIKAINSEGEYAIRFGNSNIFESSWYMRGFENMLVDLYVNKELAWQIMSRVTDYFISFFQKALQAADGLIDIVFTADDLGQQQGLIMSKDLWEEMIKPHHARINKVLHEYGVKIMYHTDGAVMEVVPGLIDMGIDILEPLQFDASGMSPELLKENYGDRLCFHGGVSVQKTLPFGTIEDVKNEVMERINILGKNGGYILAPSHAVQAGTPPQNIVTMLETARNYYFR